jgi:hypothetical protein
MRSLLSIAVIGVVVIALVLFFEPLTEAFRNQVTVYPIGTAKDGALFPLNPSVYKVFPESQSVVHWMPGVDSAPSRLDKCAVRDRLNWRCEYSDGSAVLSMDNGKFRVDARIGDRLAPDPTRYVSRSEWRRIQRH